MIEHGCVRLFRSTYCEGVNQYRPALRIEHRGRRILLRARAMGLDLEPVEQEVIDD